MGLIRGDLPSAAEPGPLPPAAPPPAAPAPEVPPPAQPAATAAPADAQDIDLGAWLLRFQASLDADHAAGRLTTNTRRNYAMAATHLAEWIGLRGRPVRDPADLEPLFTAYCEELVAGTSPVGRKTDLTLGRPAVRRWASLPAPRLRPSRSAPLAPTDPAR